MIFWAFTAGSICCIKYPSETAASKCLLGSVLVKLPVCVMGQSNWALSVLVSGLGLLRFFSTDLAQASEKSLDHLMDCHFEPEKENTCTENIKNLKINSYMRKLCQKITFILRDRGLPPIAVRADVRPLLIAATQVKGAILQLALGIGFFFLKVDPGQVFTSGLFVFPKQCRISLQNTILGNNLHLK